MRWLWAALPLLAYGERAQLARNFGVNHPLIREGDAKIASVRAMISEEMERITANLENDVRVAAARVDQIAQGLVRWNEDLRRRSRAEIHLRELERDLLTEQKLYDAVSARLGKLDPYSDVAEPGARVVSLAEVPSNPSSPDHFFLVTGGFTGSLVLAFIVAMTLESLDTRVRSSRRVSQILRLPVLASVPELPRRSWRKTAGVLSLVRGQRRSAFAEQFRSVYNACRRSGGGGSGRAHVVLVSSGMPLEGRTTTAIGLAVAAASEGARTVLVDLDLRTGGLREMLRIPEDATPLEQYLQGACGLLDILYPVEGVPKLSVIVSAASGEHTASALNSDRLESLVHALRSEHDFIVIDAPPLLAVEDAASIAPLVDTALLVAAWARTREEELAEIGERLRLNEIPVAGIVLNRVDPQSQGDGRRSRHRRKQLQRYFAT